LKFPLLLLRKREKEKKEKNSKRERIIRMRGVRRQIRVSGVQEKGDVNKRKEKKEEKGRGMLSAVYRPAEMKMKWSSEAGPGRGSHRTKILRQS